jgi:hypothetical protein
MPMKNWPELARTRLTGGGARGILPADWEIFPLRLRGYSVM